MGDRRFDATFARLKGASHRLRAIRALTDTEVVFALAGARAEADAVLANALATEAADRLRRAAAAQRAVENLREGVVALDASGNVTFLNPVVERLLGWRRESLLGESLHEKLHAHEGTGGVSPAECDLSVALRSPDPVRADDVFVLRDGTHLPVSYSSAPVEGAPGGVVLLFRTLVDADRVEAALRHAQAPASTSGAGVDLADAAPPTRPPRVDEVARRGDVVRCGECGYDFVLRRAARAEASCVRCQSRDVRRWRPGGEHG